MLERQRQLQEWPPGAKVGATTQALFERYGVDCTKKILGDEVWAQIVSGNSGDARSTVYFAAEGVRYQVALSPTPETTK